MFSPLTRNEYKSLYFHFSIDESRELMFIACFLYEDDQKISKKYCFVELFH